MWQQVVVLSSAEAEFCVALVAGMDVQYISRLTEELRYPKSSPTLMHEDSMACIYMSESIAMYHKARHIDTCVCHLRNLVSDGVLKLVKIAQSIRLQILSPRLPLAWHLQSTRWG